MVPERIGNSDNAVVPFRAGETLRWRLQGIRSRRMEIEAALERIKAAVGPRGWIADPAEQEPYLVEARRLWRGATRLVVRPASTEEVAEVVRICAEAKLPIVPQGGNTGLVGGGVPPEDGQNIVLGLGRMNRIRAIDPVNFTMTVEAGCILAHLQQAAAEVDRLFPLSLGAEGSCQIGGNLSTNAGGIAVLRYGNTRELAFGLEVVLPDGRIWDGLRGLRKDNTGYDLKQLFIGGEGTLGIITAATLKLFPKPREIETAFLGLSRSRTSWRSLLAPAPRPPTSSPPSSSSRARHSIWRWSTCPGPSIRSPSPIPGTCCSKCRRAQTESGLRALLERLLETRSKKVSSPTASSPKAAAGASSSGASARRWSRRSSIRARSSTTSRCR